VTAAAPEVGRVVLDTSALTKHFGGVHAVSDVDMHVHEGIITALIGPNGAGKTTVFNMITGIYPATRGHITYYPNERDRLTLSGMRTDLIARAGVARTFQNIRLFGDLPALDNVMLGMHTRTVRGPVSALLRLPAEAEENAVADAAFHYLELVGLAHQSHELASNLPYGAQRRLEIARALALDPTHHLIDEPAAGINPHETEDLMELIERIRGLGITILLIEHDMKLVMGISQHVVVLDHGSVISAGPPAKVRADPEVIRAYLGDEAL